MNKIASIIALGTVLSASPAYSAIYAVTNLVSGNDDTLFQNAGLDASASLMDTGIVSLGYFGDGVTPSSSLGDIATTISSFTPVASGLFGGPSAQAGGNSPAGYIDAAPVDTPNITGSDALIGRPLYVFVGNAATLAASTAFGLTQVATIADDIPNENTYLATAAGSAPLIGQINTDAFTGDPLGFGGGPFTFDTFQLEAVPEPSALLLSAFGALALLRRKR